jgi:hypothetical protein
MLASIEPRGRIKQSLLYSPQKIKRGVFHVEKRNLSSSKNLGFAKVAVLFSAETMLDGKPSSFIESCAPDSI